METYTSSGDASPDVLSSLGLAAESAQQMIQAVKEGIPVRSFSLLAKLLGVSEAALAEVVGLSSSTLGRRKRSGRLSAEESEHVLRVARLLELAVQTFGDLESASAWFRDENLSLGGATPLRYADTEVGAREVENLLGRIRYGVYS